MQIFLRIPRTGGNRMREKNELVIHLPDLFFVQWCEKKYGLNRGVYNTIDAWFYENGMKDILKRRKRIVYFLNHYTKNQFTGDRIKFGAGRLTPLLSDYTKLKVNPKEKGGVYPSFFAFSMNNLCSCFSYIFWYPYKRSE